jgi:hypothetical protein
VVEIARASRVKGEKGKEKLQPVYRKLLDITGRIASVITSKPAICDHFKSGQRSRART